MSRPCDFGSYPILEAHPLAPALPRQNSDRLSNQVYRLDIPSASAPVSLVSCCAWRGSYSISRIGIEQSHHCLVDFSSRKIHIARHLVTLQKSEKCRSCSLFSILSLTSRSTLGRPGSSATARRLQTEASAAAVCRFRQIVLGDVAAALVSTEESLDSCSAGDSSSLASRRVQAALELAFSETGPRGDEESRSDLARSSRSHGSAACTIATNSPPELYLRSSWGSSRRPIAIVCRLTPHAELCGSRFPANALLPAENSCLCTRVS